MNLARKIGLRIHLFNKFLNKNLNSYTFVHLFGDKKFLFLSKNTLSIRSLCNVVPIQTKKRAVKKKKISNENVGFRIAAFSTAEEYNLEGLAQDLSHRTSFKTRNFSDSCSKLFY